MEDCVDHVGSSSNVTKLDLLKGYLQVPLTAHASEISAFVTPDAFKKYTDAQCTHHVPTVDATCVVRCA